MRNKKVLFIVQAALIAAIYVALTYLSSIAGLASGTIQVRISEALCILPVFTTAAIPGLWLGCFLANMLTGGIPVDVVCGSIATLIAALYVVLTYITNLLGLASGTIQVRFSEALCILPVFTPAAIPGLFIGCLISNLITGGIIWDIIFGSIATLLGALGTYFLRKKKFVYTLPPVIANIIIVPLVLRYGYGFTTIYKGVDISLLFNAVTVGIGEIISICVLGSLLKGILSKYRNVIFKQDEA